MKHRPIFIASAIVALAAAIAAAGCGGGTSTPSLSQPATTQQQTAQASLTIVIPPASTSSSSSRSPEYVSPSTGSVTFQLPSMASPTVVAVGPGSSGCTGSTSAGYTCTASFTAPLGANQSLTVKTYASATGTGTVLSQNTVPITVAATGGNAVTVTLNGVATSLALVLNPTSVTVGTGSTFTATWSAKDASGNTIIAPGTITDTTGTAITPALTNNASAPSGFSTGTLTSGAWTVTYTGAAETSPVTFTVTATGGTGVTAGTAALTVNAAPTASPSASPTATASPSPSPTATATSNAILNGTFASGDLTSWYICYAEHSPLPAAGVSPSPSPNPAQSPQVATPGPAATAKTASYTPLQSGLGTQTADASVQTTTPNGATNGYAHMALVGHSDYPYNSGKAIGVCQNITVPAGSPTLTFGVYEGGNDNFVNSDSEADIYPSGSFSTAANGGTATTVAFTTLFAEDNCYNNLSAYNSGTGSDNAVASSTNGSARAALCGTAGDSTLVGNGGQWYQRSFSLSSFAGQNVTLFLGIWRNAGSGTSLGTTEYYSYAYYGNVILH